MKDMDRTLPGQKGRHRRRFSTRTSSSLALLFSGPPSQLVSGIGPVSRRILAYPGRYLPCFLPIEIQTPPNRNTGLLEMS